MPKISVIVPVYNAEDYIHECIQSIVKQTFSDFELILIDYFQEEYDNNWHPDKHRIYTTSDGTMKFEKVN